MAISSTTETLISSLQVSGDRVTSLKILRYLFRLPSNAHLLALFNASTKVGKLLERFDEARHYQRSSHANMIERQRGPNHARVMKALQQSYRPENADWLSWSIDDLWINAMDGLIDGLIVHLMKFDDLTQWIIAWEVLVMSNKRDFVRDDTDNEDEVQARLERAAAMMSSASSEDENENVVSAKINVRATKPVVRKMGKSNSLLRLLPVLGNFISELFSASSFFQLFSSLALDSPSSSPPLDFSLSTSPLRNQRLIMWPIVRFADEHGSYFKKGLYVRKCSRGFP